MADMKWLMDSRNESLGVIIKRMRTDRHLLQQDAADLAGITQQTLSRLENGITLQPKRKTLKKLARFYGASIPLKINGVTEWIGEDEVQDDGNNGDYE